MKKPNKVSGFQKSKWKHGKQKNNKMKKTNRQNKLHIKFDPEDRRAYLTGFQKRKKERREKAFKKLQEDLKAEMKQIKKDRKDIVKKMIQQSHELMENGGIGMIDDEEEEEEEDKNKLTVNCGSATVEICDLDLTSKHHIGVNQMEVNTDDSKSEKKQASVEKQSVSEKEGEDEDEEDVSPENLDRLGIHSQRDLYRSLKKSSAMVIKRSSLMKKKQVRDATKQKKAQARENNRRRKLKAKKMRHKHSSKKE